MDRGGELTPEQFLDRVARRASPEQRLVLAVVFDAFAQVRRGGMAAVEAQRWLRGEIPNPRLSFDVACGVLGVDATELMSALDRAARLRLGASPSMRPSP